MHLLVTVKAYPVRTDGHGEAVCVAGVRLDADPLAWIRVFPVPFRRLPKDQQFRKYDVIAVDVVRSADSRPESWEPRADTIQVIDHKDTKKGWLARREMIEPLLARSMCEVQRRQAADGTSLGVFRPREILDWTVEPAPPRAPVGTQMDIFEPSLEALEDIPYKFRYRYTCRDEADCPGHHQRLLDWELGQAYRGWRGKYGGEDGVLAAIRQKWYDEIVGPDRDVMFFVGNIAKHPKSFCVLGVFWPPAVAELALF